MISVLTVDIRVVVSVVMIRLKMLGMVKNLEVMKNVFVLLSLGSIFVWFSDLLI